MQAQQFNFKFMVMGISAILDAQGGLRVTMGLRKLDTSLVAVKYLYVVDHGGQGGQELLLCHEVAPGKTKIFRITSDHGNPEFQRFVHTLAQLRPEADLRALDMRAAHDMMGATNVTALVPLIMVPLITACFAVFALPWFIHGLDRGHIDIDVAAFADSPELDSRNVTVHAGQLLVDQSLQIETTSDSGTSIEWAIPLVPPDWRSGDPIHVVLKTHELSGQEAAALDPASIDGVVRNVLWEGLDDDETSYFRDSIGVSLSENVVEVEYQAETTMELIMGISMVGFVFVLMVIVAFVVARQQKKRSG